VEDLIAAGKWYAVEGVHDEIGHVGCLDLKVWANTNKAHFLQHDKSILKQANAITSSFPGLIDPYARHDEADRYVIALAKLNNWTVVTHETPALRKKMALRTHFIPDVCREIGVICIDLLDLMRNEGWNFN
jgi:hypothetical protein